VPAEVSAFGAVFSDVDLANSTTLQYFDAIGNLLHEEFVPEATVANGGLSFSGAIFGAGERIARVRIITGTDILSAVNDDDPLHGMDLVAMDDFIYGEPLRAAQAVPEPSTWALLGSGAMALFVAATGKRRRVARIRA
jgi:hypothetical protein